MASREIGPLEVVELMAVLDRAANLAAEKAMKDEVKRTRELLSHGWTRIDAGGTDGGTT